MEDLQDINIKKYNIYKSYLDKQCLFVVLNGKEVLVDSVSQCEYGDINFHVKGINKIFTEYLTKIRIK